MVESKLLIDLGNSRLKWVCARNGKIDKESAGSGDFESFSLLQSTVSGEGPGSVLVSSVAGSAGAQKVARFCETQWGVTADLLQSRAEQGGVRNGYQEPATLGVDRWLAIVGAVSRHGKPLVIWDLGTATTLDTVDDSGQHLGGLILPGPGTMLDSLTRDTKLMVPPVLQYAPPVPGLNTSEGIRGGVLAAQLGALNQFMRAVSERFQGEPSLIVTGGAAEQLLVSLDFDYIHDPWLVFRGMLVD
jgi:type III pantothenate kinase